MDTFVNFYPCNPGQFSHDNWVCGTSSGNNCDNPSFIFDPGALFVPPIEAATSTVTVTGSATAHPSSTITASGLPSVDLCPTHNSAVIGVGVGLGVGLGLLAIAALFGFLIERRKRKSAEKDASRAQTSGFYQSDLKGYPNSEMPHEAGSQILHEIGHSRRS